MILMQMPAVINEIARPSERCRIDGVRSSSLEFSETFQPSAATCTSPLSASSEIRKHCTRITDNLGRISSILLEMIIRTLDDHLESLERVKPDSRNVF